MKVINRDLGHQRRRVGILFMLPALALVSAFLGIPIFQAMYYSFTQWDGLTTLWVGIGTYSHELHNPIFWRVLENNGLLLIGIPVAMMLPMGLAFLLNEKVPGWKVFRTIYFLPTAISWVVIGMVSLRFFAQEGLLNGLLKAFGLGFVHTDLLSSEKGALLAVSFTFIWSMIGTNTIIFLTGMATLDNSLNEAARMDGASSIRIFRSITLPQLQRFIQFSFIITVISAFTALFSLIFVMTGGGPGFGTTTLEFFIYQSAFSRGDFGTGAMLGVILFFMMAVLGIGQLAILRNRDGQ
ncbi:MAG TPA: sugar ABC transporter permease [Candidatus Paceibacterota bacterium]|nr:sugar ABC transporter permease [Candidatus Paceibacterota bacterium]